MSNNNNALDYLRLHQYCGLEPGPKVLILGAVHGNEICGSEAIAKIIQALDERQLKLLKGQVTFIPVTNPLAHQLNQRMGDRNLNRNMRPVTSPQDYEDRIANVLCPHLSNHDILLDLHSFHTEGIPFALIGPQNNQGDLEPFQQAQLECRLAAHLGVSRIVEGWMDTYAKGVRRRRENPLPGTHLQSDESYGVGTTEYMRGQGGYAVTLECGQHQDPQAPEVAYQAIMQTLILLGLIEGELRAPDQTFEVIRLVDVIDREDAGDEFVKTWKSFDRVKQGEAIGKRASGVISYALADGYIVFPNPNALPGNEWYYFAQSSTRALLP